MTLLTPFRSLLAVLFVMFSFAPAALAADSSTQGYGGPGGSTQTAIDPGTTPADNTASSFTTPSSTCSSSSGSSGSGSNCSSKSLAFTGSDILLIALMGGGMLLIGFGLRRLAPVRR
jgi:hypothetical protein